MKILLVEDNRMDVELALDAFRQLNMADNIQVVENGQKALDYLFGRDNYTDRNQYPLPDLVLLDLKMPGLSGHDVLQQIKTTPGLKRLPVVILTSSKEEEDVLISYDNGANSYLVKSISFEGFMEMIEQVHKYWFKFNVAPPTTLLGPVE